MTIKLNVKQRANYVGTLRFVSVFLMETLARWIPLIPEMEAKMLLSRQVWRMAQQADRLGKRARELRAPLHFSRPPRAEFLAALKKLAAVTDTIDRVDAFHDVALTALEGAYKGYLSETDKLTDEPTVMICDLALSEIDLMRRERNGWNNEIPKSRAVDSPELRSVRQEITAAKDLVDQSETSALAS